MNTTPMKLGRIKEYDSLRGIAALGVVFWHYGTHFGAKPLPNLLVPFYNSGYLLVDFFFVLSGYVIARAYAVPERSHRLLDNMRSRFARLYPLHFFTLIVVAVLQGLLVLAFGAKPFIYQFNDTYHFILNSLLLNGTGLQSGYSYNGPSWSISTEFIANTAFLVALASGIRTRVALVVIFLVICVTLYTRSGVLLANDRVFGLIDPQLARCFVGFGCGSALLLLERRYPAFLAQAPEWLASLLVLACFAGLVLLLLSNGPHATIPVYLRMIAVSTLLLFLVRRSGIFGRLLGARPLVLLGDMSYSIYLTHFPLQVLFILAFATLGIPANFGSLGVLCAYIVLVIGVSWCTYRYVEIPGQRVLRAPVARTRLSSQPAVDEPSAGAVHGGSPAE